MAAVNASPRPASRRALCQTSTLQIAINHVHDDGVDLLHLLPVVGEVASLVSTLWRSRMPLELVTVLFCLTFLPCNSVAVACWL